MDHLVGGLLEDHCGCLCVVDGNYGLAHNLVSWLVVARRESSSVETFSSPKMKHLANFDLLELF